MLLLVTIAFNGELYVVVCICNNEFGEIEDNICNIGKVRDRDGGGAAVKNGNVRTRDKYKHRTS